MPRGPEYVLVLWGDKFDETSATIFVTELRKAGFLVKLVGLTPPKIVGACGVALAPDLMLDAALSLASHTTCLVIPCPAADLKRLKNDPRLGEFICQAASNQARFVIGQPDGTDIADLRLFPALDHVESYPGCDTLVSFVRNLARSLPGSQL
jgi:putative intracellular protease/amidase